MAAAAELFTISSFGQIGGATLAVSVCATVARQLLKTNTPWIPFISALVISLIGAGVSGALKNPFWQAAGSVEFWTEIAVWATVVLNAGLLFCGALGINASGRALTEEPDPQGRLNTRTSPKVFAPYFAPRLQTDTGQNAE
jgi:hypothetical protein